MRYNAPSDTHILRRSALGPAATAAHLLNVHHINRGLQPVRVGMSAEMMRRGGSMGAMGHQAPRGALGCLCGPGDPNFLGAVAVVPQVKIGPIALRMIQLRKAGQTPQAVLLDALTVLDQQKVKTVTPEIHLQLAAGLQPMAATVAVKPIAKALPAAPRGGMLRGFGSLGLAPVATAGVTGGSLAASSVGVGAATALGIGSGIAIGQTMIPIPVVGAIIGAIVFEAMQLLKRHVGKAEAAWTSPGFYASLRVHNGREYDEKQFSEAFKGMMDTGNNIVPGCGPDRHKNPDCLLGPMAQVIAQGYLKQIVPLSATTSQVFQYVVKPWLQSGAGGLVNWQTLAGEPTQLLMLQAATDRYLAGQAMTRGDMPAYSGQGGAHTPSLVQALQPMLQQPVTNQPQVTGVLQPVPPYAQVQQPGMQAPNIPVGGGGPTSAYNPGTMYAPSGGGGGGYPVPVAMPQVQGPRGQTGATGMPAQSAPGGLAAMIPWGLVIAAGAAVLS